MLLQKKVLQIVQAGADDRPFFERADRLTGGGPGCGDRLPAGFLPDDFPVPEHDHLPADRGCLPTGAGRGPPQRGLDTGEVRVARRLGRHPIPCGQGRLPSASSIGTWPPLSYTFHSSTRPRYTRSKLRHPRGESPANHGFGDAVPSLRDALRHPGDRHFRRRQPQEHQSYTVAHVPPSGDTAHVAMPRSTSSRTRSGRRAARARRSPAA